MRDGSSIIFHLQYQRRRIPHSPSCINEYLRDTTAQFFQSPEMAVRILGHSIYVIVLQPVAEIIRSSARGIPLGAGLGVSVAFPVNTREKRIV